MRAGELHTEFPQTIVAGERYVIYSHGLVVEGENPRPTHERWGIYEFPAIRQRLSQDSEFVLISHHRPADTDIGSYASMLVSWVDRLIAGGVQAHDITLVGFSRGGELTALAANELRPLPVNVALLATCWEGGVKDRQAIRLSGRFLSIFETTDTAHSCSKLAQRSSELASFEEIAITTGREHGAFFTPMPQWTEPLLQWIHDGPGE